tara:strand:- start:17220 stop:18545 length:1326 start_codon:yes stop_codon:yes gene_type:complete
MRENADTFIRTLDQRTVDIVDACTACGKCADVCPTPGLIGITDQSSESLTQGVIDILAGRINDGESARWAQACCGTGHCLDVCPEGINPRFMLTMGRRALNTTNPTAKQNGRDDFKTMSHGVRMLSRLQLPPELLARINPPSNRDTPKSPPDVVFYTGCNLLKTPHIGLLCLDVLDKLGVRYEVYGGPGNCCGILQFRPGDTENAGRQIMTTMERFDQSGADEVLAWCPTCNIQFNEVAMPGLTGDAAPSFDMNMFPVYLARQLDALRPLMQTPVPKKVALMEFPGARGVTEAVTSLLQSIPELELVDLGLERAGYQFSSLSTLPGYAQKTLTDLFNAAENAGVDMLCSVFHADHRELVSHDAAWPYEIVNYMDVIGAGMGLHREDIFKRLKLMQDVDAVIAAQAATLEDHSLSLEQARDAVLAYMLNEQTLPIERSQHPA